MRQQLRKERRGEAAEQRNIISEDSHNDKIQSNDGGRESSRNISLDDEIDEALRILDSFKVTLN